jgi:hypothetical protein
VPEGVSSVDGSGGNQDQIGLRSGTSVDDEAKHETEKDLEEVTTEQNKVVGAKIETRMKAGTSTRQPQNWTVRFPKSDHPISVATG